MTVRHCAWATDDTPAARPVWSRHGVIAFQCPKSLSDAQSLRRLELYGYWKRLRFDIFDLPAKDADALLLLEEEFAKEMQNESKQ